MTKNVTVACRAASAIAAFARRIGRTMPVERRALFRFITLYFALFSAFGFASPFLPAFLAGRGLGPEEVGFVLGAATALRLVSGPIAGRLADRLQAFEQNLLFVPFWPQAPRSYT